jgi:hypothetical protein
MNATSPARVGLQRLLLFVAAAAAQSAAVCRAADTGGAAAAESAAESPSMPRRSHIQPVGEMAVNTRNADTLGLRLARASEVLRQQLALARGAGLVVEEVIEGSVADKAGFKRYDVLVLLDDQMLLLPEQLAALLEASDSGTAPECTLLRGGVKVTIPLAQPGQVTQPRLSRRSPTTTPGSGALPTSATEPPAAVRQLAAKPSTQSRLRPAASTLSLVQPRPTATAATSPRDKAADIETLLRQDPDCHIRLSRGAETRLVVTDPRGRLLFDREIDSPDGRRLIPEAVIQRVDEMERSLESTSQPPAAEIGRLDTAPIEIR